MNIFDSYQKVPKYNRNLFDLSRENLFSCNFGQLVPIMCEPLFPGDSFKLSPSAIVKTAPMLAPIYGQINVDIHCFVVPLRILWDRFDDWIYDPTKTPESGLTPPFIDKLGLMELSQNNNLLNYLKLPHLKLDKDAKPDVFETRNINVFKILGYLQIWKEYFRDEDLQSYPAWLDTPQKMDYNTIFTDGETEWFTEFRKRCWRKDYFTSARPWPQKGTPPVLSLFQSSEIPVNIRVNPNVAPSDVNNYFGNFVNVPQGEMNYEDSEAGIYHLSDNTFSRVGSQSWFWDTSQAAGVSIAELRSLFAVQKYLEMSAVVGSRYIEGNLAFWGVKVKDYRAQIPEFLGMTTQILHIDEIVQNSETDRTVQGHRTGQGSTAFVGKTFKYYASEFSLVYVLFSIRPRAVYPLGVDRFWNQLDQFDFPTPIFQSIGEQEVHQEELGVPKVLSDWEQLEKTFGYQSRYAHVRSAFDEIHGDFLDSLNFWHMARFFDHPDLVDLASDFITINGNGEDEANQPLNRIFAVTDEEAENNHKFWCDAWIGWRVKRELHYHTTPALIG